MSDKKKLFATDNLGALERSIAKRKPMYDRLNREDWSTMEAKLETMPDGERVLRMKDFEIMADFQKPYMKVLANSIAAPGGLILNIGFGLGRADSIIQTHHQKIREHHIVEINAEIFATAEAWRAKQSNPDKIILHKGDCRDVLPELQKARPHFDGVLYDGYPLTPDELCCDAVAQVTNVLSQRMVTPETGRIAFYLDAIDGMGESFKAHLRDLGVRRFIEQIVPVTLTREIDHWFNDHFVAPVLTDIHYPD